MATTNKSTPAPILEAEKEIPLSLDEYCTRLAAKDSRVELIGGFASAEAQAGTTQDVDSAFTARFNKFVNLPA
ncbi:hypothetical protein LXA47_19330 [Massilia sp. P8910]|uniref:hypothetical protein n=1 Tax=Massilia antarctica TaxID=2765360 RepID=UPI001E5B4A59|nr:hypothetical protein [Massilia antarctica]MCE3605740.1 hypothetical protein [Massilia antarctica]